MAILWWVFALVFVFPVVARAAELPSLKMLSTPTCPACNQMCRVLDQLSGDYAGKVTVEKVNLIENRDIARKYNVKFVPHLLFLDEKGNVVKEKVGGVSIDEALAIFREAGVEI